MTTSSRATSHISAVCFWSMRGCAQEPRMLDVAAGKGLGRRNPSDIAPERAAGGAVTPPAATLTILKSRNAHHWPNRVNDQPFRPDRQHRRLVGLLLALAEDRAADQDDLALGCQILGSQRGIIAICRRNRAPTRYTDDAEKLRG
jgi:hypothetical protein